MPPHALAGALSPALPLGHSPQIPFAPVSSGSATVTAGLVTGPPLSKRIEEAVAWCSRDLTSPATCLI